MRARIRKIQFGGGPIAAAVLIAACSVDDVELGATDPVVSDSEGDSSPTPDAGPAVDARPPFDPSAETVTCTAEPCAVELVAGENHFCARMSDGTARCWGDDFWGQLGRGDAEEPIEPGSIPPVVDLSDAVQISAAGRATCALLANGAVSCWGSNLLGELGLHAEPPFEDFDRHPVPSPVALDGAIATRVEVGIDSACAALTTGELACWGGTQELKLARSDVWDRGFPAVVGPGNAEVDASAYTKTFVSSKTTLALTKTGEVFSWGAIAGTDGIVSGRISSVSPSLTPKRVEELSNVTSVAVSALLERQPSDPNQRPGGPGFAVESYGHACAIANGEVFCWGKSFHGALCTGLPDSEPVPKLAPTVGPAWPQQITVGDETTCVRMSDGAVQCCGENTNGALATGSAKGFSGVFVRASAFKSHAVHVVASRASVCALVQGGTVECWGSNANGELGRAPDNGAYATPVKITF